MRRLGRFNKNLIAIGLVFILTIFVYSVSSAINSVLDNDPDECYDTFFSIQDICFNEKREAFDNFQTSAKISIKNSDQIINGFKVKVFGEKGVLPLIVFKTLKPAGETIISAPYEKSIYGEIKKVAIEPILNLNSDIIYCSINHGSIFEREIRLCKE